MATLSGYGPHTAAKHRILRRYLDGWLPIMGQWQGPRARREKALVLVDGFAGSGRYDTGEAGSPLVMLDAYLEHDDRERLPQEVQFIFIEKEAGFVNHLKSEIDARSLDETNATVDIHHGLFAERFPAVIEDLRMRYEAVPPTFAFIDPFGLKDNTLELTSGLAALERCEVLAYLPTGFMARFESTREFAPALDNLYGARSEWEGVRDENSLEKRRLWLRDRFGEVISAQTGGHHLSFDIQPEGSANIYSLVFSSQHRKGVQRMKEAMWKVDPSSGQFFRGGLRPKQAESLFDQAGGESDELAIHFGGREPDYSVLERRLREHFGSIPFRIEEAADFTLFETVFRDDKHLKRPVLGRLEREGGLRVVESPRAKSMPGGYPDGTILQFVD
jgi:three-Cys-motif partner protein